MKINVKEYINTFGCRIFCMKAIRSKFYNNYSNIGVKICLLNENIIKNFLQKNIVDEIKEINSTDLYFINTDVPKNSIIWTMWWQGLDDAPDIVKACISNLKKKNPSRKVIVITKKNYQQYVHLSSQIIQNLKIREYCDLLDYFEEIGDNDYWEIASNHTYFFDKYITSCRNKEKLLIGAKPRQQDC